MRTRSNQAGDHKQHETTHRLHLQACMNSAPFAFRARFAGTTRLAVRFSSPCQRPHPVRAHDSLIGLSGLVGARMQRHLPCTAVRLGCCRGTLVAERTALCMSASGQMFKPANNSQAPSCTPYLVMRNRCTVCLFHSCNEQHLAHPGAPT